MNFKLILDSLSFKSNLTLQLILKRHNPEYLRHNPEYLRHKSEYIRQNPEYLRQSPECLQYFRRMSYEDEGTPYWAPTRSEIQTWQVPTGVSRGRGFVPAGRGRGIAKWSSATQGV